MADFKSGFLKWAVSSWTKPPRLHSELSKELQSRPTGGKDMQNTISISEIYRNQMDSQIEPTRLWAYYSLLFFNCLGHMGTTKHNE